MLSSLTPSPTGSTTRIDREPAAPSPKPALKPKPEYLKSRAHTPLDERFAQQLAQNTDAVTSRRRAFQQQQQRVGHQQMMTTHTEYTRTATSATATTTFKRASSVVNTSCTTGSSTLRSERLSARMQLLDDMPSIFTGRPAPTPAVRESAVEATASFFGRTIERNFNGGAGTRRTKFRVSQSSRDVPIGSPDTHRPIFLDEACYGANGTTDSLLQLLDKYNGNHGNDIDSDARHSTFAVRERRQRNQSLSFGDAGCATTNTTTTTADSVDEQRSMNSLNFFFQRHAVAGSQVRQMQAQLESKKRQQFQST